VSSSSGKALPEAALSGSNQEKKGDEEHCRCVMWAHTLLERVGDFLGGKIEARARFARVFRAWD
jgi:hypothetical protein